MRSAMWKIVPLILLCFALGATTRAAAKHPYGANDWASLRSASSVAVAPDGNTILYRVDFGGRKGSENHEWRLVRANGTGMRRLRLPKGFEPFGFTADGTALYGALRSKATKGRAQLAVANLKGGKAYLLTHLPSGIRSAQLSPNGTKFAVLADPRKPDLLAKVRIIVTNRQTSVYVVDANGKHGAWWCPSLHDIQQVAWSPDGSSLAVESSVPKIGHHFMHSSIDVCTQDRPRQLAAVETAMAGLGWVRGGRRIAFLSTKTHVLTPDHVWTVGLHDETPVDMTPHLKGSAVNLTTDTHGNTWVLVARGVRLEVDKFTRSGLEPQYRWPGGAVESLPVFPQVSSARDTLAFTVGDPTHTRNVALEQENGKLGRITHEGDNQLRSIALGPVRVVNWKGPATPLQGIVTFPAGYVSGRRYKFLVLPHGGPESNDRLDLDPLSRLVAGLGYVVLQPEYRGSTGYGSAFLNAIYQHFGDRAYEDVNSATSYAVAQGWADPHRLAIFGWSAGGFMTAWTVTQTHRYRAAVEGAGITDWLSFIPTSDIAQIDYDARFPERNPEPFLKFSAVQYAEQVTTPLLIMDGTKDVRVPTFQGRELFILLAEKKKTVKQVLYPGSPHFPKLWQQRRSVWNQVREWLNKYNP